MSFGTATLIGADLANLMVGEGVSASDDSSPKELIVELSDDVSKIALEDIRTQFGMTVAKGADTSFQLWTGMDDPVAAAQAIATVAGVEFLDLNVRIGGNLGAIESVAPAVIEQPAVVDGADGAGPASDPGIARSSNDPYLGSLYGLSKINAQGAWDTTTGSSEVVIGVIDTGIDVDHADLNDNIWVNTGEIWGDGIDNDGNGYVDDYNGYDFYNDQGIGPGYSRDDDHGHGTHVAGTIAAEGNNGIGVSGVAWEASLMALKFLGSSGYGSTYDATRAVRYATANGAHLTNNSWGGGGYSSSLYSAINEARAAGVLFVAAAGNSSRNTDIYSNYPSNYNLSNVISVASTTSSDGLSYFSNYGATTVDLGAPGSSVYSTYRGGGYATLSGTSMATPHVAGAIALMLSKNPGLTISEVTSALYASGDSVSSLSGRTVTGKRLNVNNALALIPDANAPISDLDLSATSFLENAAGITIGTITPTGGGGSVTYSIAADPSGLFTIRNGNQLGLRDGVSVDHETVSSVSVTLRGTDGDNNSYQEAFTLTVSDVNEAPTGISGALLSSVAEDAAIGTVLGTMTVTGDPDDGDSHTFSLLDTHGGAFAINASTGVLSVSGALDYETATSHDLTVRVTDSGGLSVDRTVSLSVSDVNEAPTIDSQAIMLSEATTVSATLRGSDAEGDAFTYALESGPANGTVTIDSNGQYTMTVNDGFTGADSFQVRTTDEHGATGVSTIGVTVGNSSATQFEFTSDPLLISNPSHQGHSATAVTALSGGGYVVTWSAYTSASYYPNWNDVFMRVYDANHQPVTGVTHVAQNIMFGQNAPDIVALPDGGFTVAWYSGGVDQSSWGISGRVFEADGQPRSSEFTINTKTEYGQVNPALAVNTDGSVLVTWSDPAISSSASTHTVRSQLLTSTGQKSGSEQTLGTSGGFAGARTPSTAALSNGSFVVVWREGQVIGHRLISSLGIPLQPSLPDPGLDIDADTSLHVTALEGGGYAIAHIYNDKNIRVQKFTNSGALDGDVIEVYPRNDLVEGHDVESIIGLEAGGFAVTWSMHHSDHNWSLWTREFDSNGIATGDEQLVRDLGSGSTPWDADIANLPDGESIISWYESDGVHMRRYQGGSSGSFRGGNTSDVMFANASGETVYGMGGNDILNGNVGNDTLSGGDGDDTLFGNDGVDDLSGGAGADNLSGGDGNDTLSGDAGADDLSGGTGNDTLTGGAGADSLSGGDGHDTLIADANDVLIDGGAGNDTLRIDGSAGGTLSIDLSTGMYGSGTVTSIESVLIETGASSTASGASSNDAAASAEAGSAASLQSEGSVSAESSPSKVDLIVDLSKAVSLETIASAKNLLGAETVRTIDGKVEFWDVLDDTVDVGKVISDLGLGDAIDLNEAIDMSASLAVESTPIEIDAATYAVTPDATVPNDPSFGSLYGMADINATEAWDQRTDASSIVVGVIDTGIDVNHPDLVNNLWVNEGEIWGDGIDNDGNGYVDDYHGYDFYNRHGIGPGYARDDDHSHGTHVAGTIAAEGNNGIGVSGVAWQAQLMAVKIFSGSGFTNTTAIVEGIRYATMMGARVTNNSWGGGGYSSSVYNAINNARTSGSIFVAAAGNNYGNNNDVSRYYPSGYSLDNIVAVASTDSADRLSSFSNYGATTVDLGAPGSSIYSTTPNGSYGYKSGTSMATPHVAGALALVMAENPSLSYSEAISVVLDNTESLSSLSGRTLTGGRLDLHAALSSVQPSLYLGNTSIIAEADITSISRTLTATGSGASDTPLTYRESHSDVYDAFSMTQDGASATITINPDHTVARSSVDLGVRNNSGISAGGTMHLTMTGVSGGNTITAYAAGEGHLIYAGDGDDTVFATRSDDVLFGGSGNDELIGMGGSDTIDGGTGTDTLSFVNSDAGVTASLVGGDNNTDTLISIEALRGSTHADALTGSSGNDILLGDGGNDTLTGGDGADSLIGGAGTDYAVYTDVGGVTVSLSDTRRSGSAVGDTFDGVEGLIGAGGNDLLVGDNGANSLFGAGGSDTLIGGDGADFLSGDDGNDLIIGGAGGDTLHGGTGDDIIFSGTGNDTVDGGTGADTLHLGYVTGALNIDFDAGTASGADIGTVTFQNVEFITYNSVTGGAIAATSAQETFADTGTLTLSYANSDAGVTLDLDAGSGTGGFAEGDSLYGISAVRGSDHNDRIVSGGADETIDGGTGTDTVVYGGNIGEYALSIDNGTITVADSVAGRDGTDSIVNAEALEFADGTLSPNEGVSILMSGGSVAENTTAGATVGTVTAFTLTGETFSLSLTDGASGAIDFDPATGVLTTTRSFDFETEPSANIVVTASGDQGTTVTQTLAVAISNVNEAPGDIGTSAFTIAEDAGVGDAVGTIDVNDPDAGDSHSFNLTGNAGGLFSIDEATGVIRVAGALDHETAGVHTLTVQGTDSGGLSNSWPVTVTVGDINEAPTISPAPLTVGEHAAIGSTIGTFTATDQDDGDSVTFSLTDDADGRFTIDSATGAIRLAASLDYESAQGHTIRARATDSGGLTSDTVQTVLVQDENDAPIAQTDAALVQEEQALTLSAPALLGNDSDPDGDPLTISSVGNAQNGTVALDGFGNVVFTPDAETVGAASFDYTISDGRGGSDTATVNLTIEAQPQDITGGDSDDEMTGGSESDQLSGGAGADTLMGRKGDDVLMGGTGDDVYVFRAGDGADTLNEYAEETVTGTRQVAYTYTTSHRRYVSSGESGSWQTFYQSRVGMRAESYQYNQQTDAGNDTLRFGTGISLTDLSATVDGNDLILRVGGVGGAGIAAAGDSLRLSNWFNEQERIENFAFEDNAGQTLTATDILSRFGTDGADTITWTESAVSLDGGAGNDALTVGDSDDTLTGGTGNDVLNGGGGTDEAVYSGRLEDYTIDLSQAQAGTFGITDNRGTDGTDTLIDIETLRFTDGTLGLTGDNIAPFARDDTATTDEDVALTLGLADVSANDISLDGDALSITAVGSATGGSVALDDVGDIVFTPDANYNGAASFTYTVADPAGASSSATVAVTVNAVNDAPGLSADSASGQEDTALTIALSDLLSNDSDIDGDALTVTAVNGASNGTVTLDGLGNAVFTPDADFVGAASFAYTASDGQGGSGTQTVSLNITNTNDAPVDASFSGSDVSEAAAIGTAVGTVGVTDVDSGDSHTFSLTDTAGDRFSINATTGVVSVAGALNYEDTQGHTITVQVTDSAGASYSEAFSVGVTDANEAPVMSAIGPFSLSENAAAGSVLGTVSASDVDAGDNLTFSLTDDANGLFGIDSSTGQITLSGALDYETATSHTLGVQVSDSGGLSVSNTATVSVIDGNDAPITGESSLIIRSGAASAFTTVASDPNSDALTFGGASAGSGSASISADGTISYTAGAGAGADSITFTATDTGGLSADGTVNVSVIGTGTDLTGTSGDDIIVGGAGSDRVVFTGNQSDYQITQAGSALLVADGQAGRDGTDTVSAAEELVFADSTLAVDGGVILLADGLGVAENTANGGDVGAVSLLNFTGSSLTLSLLDDAGGRFNIDGQTGSLTVAGALDHEGADSHTVTIGILDSGGTEIARRAVDIAVNDVNEAPVDLSATSFAINEDSTVGDAVGTVTVNDPDAGDSHSLTLTNDAGGLFTIDAATGVISVAGSLDHETAGTHTLTVQGTDSGGLSNSWPITVSIGDVNEAPVSISADMTADILESAANGSVVGTISASDLDAGDSLTFSLTDNAGGLFTIDRTSGEITLNGALDRETAASHVLGVRATDAGGLTLDGTATVAVGDVDEAPITAADTLSTSEETDLLIDVSQLLGNDADPEGGTLTLVSVGNAQNGSVSIGSGGLVQFRPDAVFTGTASFDYTVRDAGGNQTTESVTVDVTELQRQLIGGDTDDVLNGGSGDDTMEGGAGDDTLYGRRGTDNLAGGTGNDLYRFQRGDGSDVINEHTMETLTGSRLVPYTYTARESYRVNSGESSFWASRTVTRTAYRSESFEYQAQAEGGSDRIHFGLGIAAGDLAARFDGNDLVLTISASGSSAASGDEIRINEWTNSLSRIEEITFEGDSGTTLTVGDMVGLTTTDGDDTITWTETSATIDGRGGNDAIVTGAFDDTVSGGDGNDDIYTSSGNDILSGGAGNDRLDGCNGFDAAVFSGNLENYRLNFQSASQLTVADLTGRDGTDTLIAIEELRFNDGTLALAGGNIATFVRNDTFSVSEDSVTTLTPAQLTGNDLSLDGDPIHLVGVSNASNGAVSLVGGNVVFAPTAEFSGAAGFDYTVSDGRGGTSTGRVTMNVSAVDDASTGLSLSGGSVAENLAAGSIVGTVTAQDPDIGDSHSYTLLNHADLFAVDSSTGLITTLASMNHEDAAQYTLTVRATGLDGLSAEHSVAVAVADVNEAPSAIALSGMTIAENSATGTAVGTASVADVDVGDTHSYTLTDDANGLFTVDEATGVIRVAGALDREVSGSHTITVQATDQGGLSTQQAATITVSDVDEAPVTAGDTGATQEDTAVTLSATALLSNDSDPESGALHIAAIVAAVGGAAVVNAGGDIVFTPDANFNGAASVDYQVSDAGGNLSTSRVDVSVAAVNDAPDAGNDTGSTAENEAVQISTATLLANDSDVEGDALSVTAVSNAIGGTAVLDTLTQMVTFTPTSGFVGDATFDYTVTDAHGDSSNATVTVSIGAVDQTLTGSADADVLTGASGNDTLYGLAGADTLSGGRGTDTLEGGAGDDIYQFNLGDGADTIVDHATTQETTTRTVSYSYRVARRVSFGEQWRTIYETRYGTREETVTQTVDTDGGADALVFGTGIDDTSLAFSMDGNDLVVSVTGTDSVRMTDWNDANKRVEEIRFTDNGTVLDAAAIDARITQGAANALKLASAMATSSGDGSGDGNTSVIEEDNNLFGQLAGSAG